MKIVSFAIPCYNSQDYMKRCIDSLLVCKEEGEIPLYDFQILSERVRVFCHCCNAEAYLPLRSEADAEDFIKTDRLDLK